MSKSREAGLFASGGNQSVQLISLPAIVATSPIWTPIVAPVVAAALTGVAIAGPLAVVGFAGKAIGLWR